MGKKKVPSGLQMDLFSFMDNEPEPALSQHEEVLTRDPFEPVQQHEESAVEAIEAENEYVIGGRVNAATRLLQNLEAVRILYQLQEENRTADEGERQALMLYSSFGAIPKVFEEDHPDYELVERVLKPDDYSAAKLAIINSFYTQTDVVDQVWGLVERMGFDGGRVLDPAFATGNFITAMPSHIRKASEIWGVDMDCLAGRIGGAIHPDVRVQISAFQKTKLTPGYFDLAITNVPFANFSVFDPDMPDEVRGSLHNYYIAKMIHLTRPGGIVAAITSRWTMDSKNSEHREWIAKQAHLVEAIRLPTKTFTDYAGCDVVTDILWFMKRDEPKDGFSRWTTSTATNFIGPRGEETLYINDYLPVGAKEVLGQYAVKTGAYAPTLHVLNDRKDYGTLIAEVLAQTEPEAFYTYRKAEKKVSLPNIIFVEGDTGRREGQYFVNPADGQLYQKAEVGSTLVNKQPKTIDRIKAMIRIAQVARFVLEANTNGSSDEILAQAQGILRLEYDRFTARFGYLNERTNQAAFKEDPDSPFLLAIEIPVKENVWKATKFFTERVISEAKPPEKVETPSEAYIVSMAHLGYLDFEFMEKLSGISVELLKENLYGSSIYRTPTGEWLPANIYLSGNVRTKLYEAEKILHRDPQMQVNIDALKAVLPDWIGHEDIHVKLGATWIDAEAIQLFTNELMDAYSPFNRPDWTNSWRPGNRSHDECKIEYVAPLGTWKVHAKRSGYSTLGTEKWGTNRKHLYDIMDSLLNQKQIVVTDEDKDGKQITNETESLAAREKAAEVQKLFREWIWTDSWRRTRLEEIYNNRFNSIVPPKFDGSHLEFPGLVEGIVPRPHQKNAAARIMSGMNVLLWHIVGAGKSLEMISATMEMKRLGIRTKPMHVVPNHLLQQYASEFYRFYPNANLLVIDSDQMNVLQRRRAMARIATENWDAIILTHNSFKRIPMSPGTMKMFHDERISEIDNYLNTLSKYSGDDKKTMKMLQAKKAKLIEKYEALLDKNKTEDVGFFWEDLGVDVLFYDESHTIKSLFFESSLTYLPGIGGSESGIAYDAFVKFQWMTRSCENGHVLGNRSHCRECGAEKRKGKSVVFASGTPITNSISEMYTVQRFLQFDTLIKAGIYHFDAWAALFGETETMIELKPSGSGWRMNTRFAKFHNVPELISMFGEIADVQMDPRELNLARPEIIGGEPEGIKVEPSQAMLDYIEECAQRADNLSNVDPKVDNMLKIMSDALKAATDMRLINLFSKPEQGNKIARVIENVYRIWWDTSEVKLEGLDETVGLTQSIFLDIGTPKKKKGKKKKKAEIVEGTGDAVVDTSENEIIVSEPLDENERAAVVLYQDIKDRLVGMGVPVEQIAFAHDAKSDHQRKALIDRVNRGEIRIIIGSTQKMGAGTNMQRLLYASHNVDAPWTPALLEQRNGRIQRQGNLNKEILIFNYITEKSLDFYKWHLLEVKARFLAQVATGKVSARTVEDLESGVLNFAQMKAMATGNELLIEKVKLDVDVQALGLLRRKWSEDRRKQQGRGDTHRLSIPANEKSVEMLHKAIEYRDSYVDKGVYTVDQYIFTPDPAAEDPEKEADRIIKEAAEKLEPLIRDLANERSEKVEFDMSCAQVVIRRGLGRRLEGSIYIGGTKLVQDMSESGRGCFTRVRNTIDKLEFMIAEFEAKINTSRNELAEIEKLLASNGFPQADEYHAKVARLEEIEEILRLEATKGNQPKIEESKDEDEEEDDDSGDTED